MQVTINVIMQYAVDSQSVHTIIHSLDQLSEKITNECETKMSQLNNIKIIMQTL